MTADETARKILSQYQPTRREAAEETMQIYARELASETLHKLLALVSSAELHRLHPYPAQYLLEETIKVLQTRV